jgi:hypothetical protein
VKAILDIQLVIDVPPPKSKVDLSPRLFMASEMARKYLMSVGIPADNAVVRYPRRLTREENIALVPRVVHFTETVCGPSLCGRNNPMKKSAIWGKVTCKPCRKRKPKTLQGELFS